MPTRRKKKGSKFLSLKSGRLTIDYRSGNIDLNTIAKPLNLCESDDILRWTYSIIHLILFKTLCEMKLNISLFIQSSISHLFYITDGPLIDNNNNNINDKRL